MSRKTLRALQSIYQIDDGLEEVELIREIEVDIDGGEHMDSMQQRITLHFLNLFPSPKVNAALRSVNSQHCLRLEGHRSQRRRYFRPSLRLTCLPDTQWTLAGPLIGLGPMLLGLLPYLGCGCRRHGASSRACHVPIHVRGSSGSELLQHLQCCHGRSQLP
ncbi:hypothetical protein PIB30_087017 [Stylosanthes scabra]|uniref:Uncharacterized protein n=1 Tax=Stylosanthes scabra TaxID=79078 RepID=A0ABU6YU31_9FABA|nr:hypothetical protein [Stylosanthes scabra]